MSSFFLDETRKRLGPNPNANLNDIHYLRPGEDSDEELIEKAKILKEGFEEPSEYVDTDFLQIIGVILLTSAVLSLFFTKL